MQRLRIQHAFSILMIPMVLSAAGCEDPSAEDSMLRYFVDGEEVESEADFSDWAQELLDDRPELADPDAPASDLTLRASCTANCGKTNMTVSGSDCTCGDGIGCVVRDGNMAYEWSCDGKDDTSYEVE